MSKVNKSITIDSENWSYLEKLARANRRSNSGMIDWLISRSKEEDNKLEEEAAAYEGNSQC